MKLSTALKWFHAIGLMPSRAETPPEEMGLAENHPGFVATCSGRLFDVVNVDPSEIEILEIAHALSQINRFAGHTKYPYSVAQHSLHCAEECLRRYPERHDLALACLLHDAGEAYVCDIIRPVKRLIKSAYGPLEKRVQDAVWMAFGIELDSEARQVIHEIDNAVVMVEARDLMIGSESWNWHGITPAEIQIRRCEPEIIRGLLLAQFDWLSEEAAHDLAWGREIAACLNS